MAQKKTVETTKGLSGMLRMFKSTMLNLGLEAPKKIAFIGCVGTCVPFVELFAYTIRESMPIMVLIPDGIIEESRGVWYVDGVGMQVGGLVDPRRADYVVLLGGISMPSCNIGADQTKKIIEEVVKPGGKVIGVCFMDMFNKAGWEDKVHFDLIMNANIDSVTLDQFS